jgi:hypothetical protein
MTIFTRIVLTFFCGYFLYTQPVLAKKRCKPLLDKVHKIQQAQRSSYSLKRGDSLRKKEDKARDKWWQCESQSNAQFKLSQKKKAKINARKEKTKKYKTRNAKVSLTRHKSPVTPRFKVNSAFVSKHHKNTRKESNTAPKKYTSNATYTLHTTRGHFEAVNFLADFEGDKLRAWGAFYQPPLRCMKPKRLSTFVSCSENKKDQKALFEQQWLKSPQQIIAKQN